MKKFKFKNKKNRKVIFLGFIIFAFIICICFFCKTNFKDDNDEMLINISELSEEFMNNYFEEYDELEKEEKENMLIVISSEKINEEDYGAKEVIESPNNKYYMLFEDDLTKEKAINKLSKEESVKSVEENIVRKVLVTKNFNTLNNETYNSWGIKAMGLNYVMNTISSLETNEVTVAILDTGLDVDLFNKYYPGRIKNTYNVLPDDEDTSMYDNYGHGTHIAGTIAEGTPDNIKIIPVKISDSEFMFESDILAAFEYITYYADVDVINMSFGGNQYSMAEYQAIEAARQKNIIAVAAAGNDNTSMPSYPAAFDNTISIASIDENLTKSEFSNYGDTITFAAPGGQINSLMADYMALSSNEDNDDEDETISGTSMATPHAVAATAILKSFNKNLSLENVIDLLKNNVSDLGAYGYDYYYGHGLINFSNSIKCDNNVTVCDEFNIFKIYEPKKMTISEVKFTDYNYGTITNLLLSTVDFLESDGYNYQKQLWQLDDIIVTGYDPYSTEIQLVTIKYLDFETTIDIQNPANYEIGWEYTSLDGYNYLSGYKDSGFQINKLYIPTKINDVTIKGILNFPNESFNMFYNSSDATYFNEIILPEGIEYIGNYAFSGLKNVSKVTIQNSTLNVGESSFSNMPFLTSIYGDITLSGNSYNVFKDNILLKDINLSNSTVIIPEGTFENCKSLDSFIIPNTVTSIGDSAFKNSGLSSIVLSNNLKQIGNESFKGSKLSNLILPDSLETIGNYAFSGNIIESIEIPKNVRSIGLAPFSGNYILRIVVSSENIYYDSRGNSNLIIETSTNKIIQGSIKSVIPSSVLIIGEESYSELNEPQGAGLLIETSRLLTSLEIPEGVTTIERNAFLNTHYLEKVIVPRSVISMDSTLFKEHASQFGKTVLWAYQDSYAYDYAIKNDCTYVVIENSSVAEIIEGFSVFFDDRKYYPYETVEIQGISYYYWDYSTEKLKYVNIPNYSISYQNGDSLRYGDDKVYFNFSIENGHQNVKLPFNVIVEKGSIEIPTVNLLIGEKIIDIATKENDFGISIEHGILYFNDYHKSFEAAGDYTVKGYFISNNSDYSDMWDIDIPVHVINKQYIKNEIKISPKIADGTTYIDPNTVTLVDVDKSYYTVVSAYLNSADDVGNDVDATVKLRLKDNIYENYAFTGNQQELEQTVKMAVADIVLPEINLLIGEDYYETCLENGCLRGYNSYSFEEPGDYTIIGYYSYNDGSSMIDDIAIPVHVINKYFVANWAEIEPKEYDGTTDVDLSTITLPKIDTNQYTIDKSQYTIISAKLESPDVSEWGMAKIKVKLNDDVYENYAFTGNKQESEWFNPIKIIKGTPKYDVPQNLKAELGQSLYDVSLPKGFEWTSENEVFNESGIKIYEAKYTPEDTKNYKIIENIKITINVSSKTFKITYKSNDENNLTLTQEVEQNKHAKLKENTFERKGFKFIEWNTKADGTGTTYNEKQEISITENLTLYAIWEETYSYIINKYSYDDNKKYIEHIDIKTTVDDFKKNIVLNTGYRVEIDLGTKDYIYTGSKTKIYNGDTLVVEFTNIVNGDVTSDGIVNIADVIKIADDILGLNTLTSDCEKIAAEVTGDEIINIADVVKIADYTLDNSIKLWR